MTNTITIPVEFFEQIKKDRDVWQEKYYVQKHNAENLNDQLQSNANSKASNIKEAFENRWLIECLKELANLASCGVYQDLDIAEAVRGMVKEVNERYPENV